MEAVMMPSIVNNDELSDETESINLDLHVSDTEESTESLKKNEVEPSDLLESEEDILNKYIDDAPTGIGEDKKGNRINGLVKDEKYKKCNGAITSHDDVGTDEDNMNDTLTKDKSEENLDETLLNEKNDTEESVYNTKDQNIVGKSNAGAEAESQDQKPIKDFEATNINECDSTIKTAVTESKNSGENFIETESQNKEVSNNEDADESSCPRIINENNVDSKKTDNDQEDDDLLCVMDEKSVEEANDNKDENSCSASERDDETKENEDSSDQNNEENMDDINEDTNEEMREENLEERNEESTDDIREDEETEENTESQGDADVDASECAMDIEDSDIGGVVYTDTRIVSSEQLNTSVSKIDADKDANKENEHNGDVTLTDLTDKQVATVDSLQNGDLEEEIAKSDIPKGLDEEKDKETQKKCTKRQLSDSSTDSESTKKIKLQIEESDKPVEREKRSIKFLDSFKKFMLDKKLKSLTRFELEELCIQKMCECIVNKSEIGELRQKVMIQEQTIDTWRKEAIVVAKQTRDLKIVHERLMGDLKITKEQTGKPLVPVKITRSVGLQAIIEHPSRIRAPPLANGTTPPQQRSPVVNSSPQQTKTIPSTQNRQLIKTKGPPPRINSANNTRPLQPITQKSNVNSVKSRQTVSAPQQKKNADLKGVIDLTDEDEKNQNAKQSTNTGSPTVRILNKQNIGVTKTSPQTPNSQTSKIMFVTPNVLQRNSAVMVKMNSNGLVSPQNGLTTIPNGQVSMVTSPVVRTVSPLKGSVTTATTVRTATPVKQIYKHPAPLPAAPNYPVIGRKPLPPKPHLNLTRSHCGTGIVLQWKMPYKLEAYETIVSYQLYAYQETKSPPKTDNWGKIGDVKALELPMAVTLTQFAVGNRYFFAVRAVDLQKRLGPFSEPENILL